MRIPLLNMRDTILRRAGLSVGILALCSLLATAGVIASQEPVSGGLPVSGPSAGLVDSGPNQSETVVLSLKELESTDKLEALTSDLQVEQVFSGFRAAHSDFVGGFALRPEQSLRDAIETYLSLQIDAVDASLKDAPSEASAGDAQALADYTEDLKGYRASLTEDGLRIFGFTVIGSTDAIQALVNGPWQDVARAVDLTSDPAARPLAPWEEALR